jgi:nucleoside-diphosphate-sugar epimerase
VAGRDALALITNIPYVQLYERLRGLGGAVSETVSRFLRNNPVLKPVLPDPGVAFQLVHHDDVARAMRSAVLGQAPPGAYNLAAPGELTMSEVASELGWYSLAVPKAAIDGLAELIERLPVAPAQAQWIESVRAPVLMDTAKARRELDWAPQHDARQTLAEMVRAAHEKGLTEFG